MPRHHAPDLIAKLKRLDDRGRIVAGVLIFVAIACFAVAGVAAWEFFNG